jgi:hypothetical protein
MFTYNLKMIVSVNIYQMINQKVNKEIKIYSLQKNVIKYGQYV